MPFPNSHNLLISGKATWKIVQFQGLKYRFFALCQPIRFLARFSRPEHDGRQRASCFRQPC